ncbi:phosphoribosylamine--glycine ligase [Selenomonas sp. TAMA-11512]|uniref:phosphoribosylamine--glycine ligase n=1 Tax=Selenomonas sp. TAMA-11512 TaxID=3095337 RepID=UPI00308C28CD|nr:phosphoribosylamine--glycine ligase [Selenomonas sp. TAMA-11512]
MNILIIGGGGREHALLWKIAQSPLADKCYAIPGNPGMEALAVCDASISIEDNEALVAYAKEKGIGLVVVGPEVPLTNGVADAFEAAGIPVFGPSKSAAEIEGSKAFSKNLMAKYDIPTAKYAVFTDGEEARTYIRKEGAPIVIKADGLAAGKGVIVAMTEREALDAIGDIMDDKSFGTAGSRVVVEEFMEGEEMSLLAFTDGETIIPMVPSQDHKRALDGDRGPNTGGMGTYAPAPVGTADIVQEAYEKVLRPTVDAMKAEGRPYKGCLYAGLMVTETGVKVVEFNCRFGDPETQVVLPLLDSDLVKIMLACDKGTLSEESVAWKDGAAVCVVMAAGGYPGSYDKGDVITGIEESEHAGCLVFHAGTKAADGSVVTNGGRVLGVVGEAEDIRSAVKKAYDGVEKIHFKDAFYRKDIAHRALNR